MLGPANAAVSLWPCRPASEQLAVGVVAVFVTT